MRSVCIATLFLLVAVGHAWAPPVPRRPSASATVAAFSPDGKLLLVGYDGGPGTEPSKLPFLRLWDVASGAEWRTLTGHTRWVDRIVWFPDGKRALSHSCDDSFRLWDIPSGREIRRWDGGKERALVAGVSSDGKLLLTWGYGALDLNEAQFKVWDVNTGKLLRSLSGTNLLVRSITFSPDNSLVLLGCQPFISGSLQDDSAIKLLNISTGKVVQSFDMHSDSWSSIGFFTPDSKYLVLEKRERDRRSGLERAYIVLWEPSQGGEVRRIAKRPTSAAREVTAETLAITMTMAPDGKRLMTADSDGTIQLWNLATGESVWSVKGAGLTGTFTAGGKEVLILTQATAAIYDSQRSEVRLQVRDAGTGRLLRTMPGPTER
jgi:WD40 repeat protein